MDCTVDHGPKLEEENKCARMKKEEFNDEIFKLVEIICFYWDSFEYNIQQLLISFIIKII